VEGVEEAFVGAGAAKSIFEGEVEVIVNAAFPALMDIGGLRSLTFSSSIIPFSDMLLRHASTQHSVR